MREKDAKVTDTTLMPLIEAVAESMPQERREQFLEELLAFVQPNSREGGCGIFWYCVVMKEMHRLATVRDAAALFELRRKSILALATEAMSNEEARRWAGTLSLAGMEQKIHDWEIWVAEVHNRVAGWIAIHRDRLEGLYTDPEFVRRGIATELLEYVEDLMRKRGVQVVETEASSNAEEFYVRRGYERVSVRAANGAQPMRKNLSA
jgi:putative acetyltransferase